MKNGIALGGGLFLVVAIAGLLLVEAKGEKIEKPADNIINESPQNNPNQSKISGDKHSQVSITVMEMPQNYTASQGEMLVEKKGKKLLLPLLHTDVFGDIEGFLARVNVTQRYVNSFDSVIEALYTFPLPENAAVDSMILKVGNKRIKGVIKERQEARDIYENARMQGKTASLLEQQRPNIFTQSVANILPGDTIVITISYLQQLKFKNGKYLFNFPMVVGPRYIPGHSLRSETVGTENPTDQVPDAHRITPPILPADTRSGHDISVQVKIHKGISLKELTSPSHRIIISESDSS
jgi:Ca-activated chloride channel homolog